MRIITFGEVLMRLNPEGYYRFVQADKLEISVGGGEANVAASLANYGEDAAVVSKVPSHEIGQWSINGLRRFGIDTSLIARGGARLGLYYAEKGASQRPSKVIYDRAGSSIATASCEDFDWNKIFDGADWFHFTGITPALGGNLPRICLMACKAAKEKGIKTSCDLNYRKKLWSREEANKCMRELVRYVDICIGNEEDAKDVFCIEASNTDINSGKINQEGYICVAKQLSDMFGFEKVAFTLRESLSASDNNWSGMLYSNGSAVFSPKYKIHIVDRVGGGDSFSAGIIYSLLHGYDDQKAINFAVAASCLKHSIEHDMNMVSLAEVESLAAGNASGRVQR